jgi:gliding motility-associated-like protein
MATTTYTVTGTDANGCTGTASVQVTVFSALTVTVTPSTADICEGDDIVLTATSNGLNPTFDWSSGQTGASITASPSSTTTYEVQVSDQNGCTGSAQSIIQVNAIPHVDFIGFPLSGCSPIQVSFTNTGDIGTFLWSFGDGATSTIANPVHFYNQSGFYTITLSVSNSGCSNSLTLTNYVHAYPVPVAGFHPSSTIISEDDASVFFSDLSVGASIWIWNFGTGDYSSEQSPEYTFTEEGQFTVWQYVENQWGCSDSISTVIWLKPIPTFYIPNAFTPNGDGVNDVFHPFGNNIDTDDYEMTIYDRWGKMVFKTTNLNTAWDGKSQYSDDTAIKQGVYVYVIKLKMDGKTKIIDGTVTLIH